ncbi:vacuolar proton translocating ATPase subunit, putative [Bodo saltans]|uniref:V-type proton ATPase subunit a n=1 Tax=Bodo saltans TaxID=75058 RepID=A0A0S4JG87_BODSA|nr:vacuolar proton translocating ATPase subunit, putative [Bodo saltans]|eukprot:CUG87992.1 vacuolar proton translocating ATPase subunit, putative [Bodo saltans]
MVKLDMTMPRDATHDTVFQLGLLGCCEFVDAQPNTPAFQRPYTSDIRRCDESLRRLRYVEGFLQRYHVLVPTSAPETVLQPGTTSASSTTSAATRSGRLSTPAQGQAAALQGTSVPSLRKRDREEQSPTVPQASMLTLDRVEGMTESQERELRGIADTLTGCRREVRKLKETILVSRALSSESGGGSSGTYGTRSTTNVTTAVAVGSSGAVAAPQQHFVAGMFSNAKLETLHRLIYRVSRGNAMFRLHGVEDDAPWLNSVDDSDDDEDDAEEDGGRDTRKGATTDLTDDGDSGVSQSVFIVYCYAPRMLEKLQRVCLNTGGRLFDASTAASERQLSDELETLTSTYRQTKQQLYELLQRCAGHHEHHSHFLLVERAVLTTMNLFRYTGVMCRVSLWIPARRDSDVRAALIEGTRSSHAEAPTLLSKSKSQANPPTFFDTNKYISIFQGIVDSYGIARYKEVNPGVFTIVTFPYLFGIMYGDVGHGVLLTMFAIGLIAAESRVEGKKQNEIFAMIFSGRYLLLLMGLFATYVGLLYNDFFGYSVGLFPSSYTWPELPLTTVGGGGSSGPSGVVHPLNPNGRPSVKPDTVYPFGIDVAWAETENKLEYYNSIKMKCAVIVGIIQMLVGILLSAMNYIRRKETYKLVCIFIPEFIFLSCTFGYMAILIVVKWCTVWESTYDAPSLLETMTNFFLSPGTVTKPLFEGQGALQAFLLLLAFSTTPVMLLVAPRMEMRAEQRKLRHRPAQSCVDEATTSDERSGLAPQQDENGADDHDDEHDDDDDDAVPHDSTEITIHYIIHTIEFVLGAVSNTASYLRLWALSLAHAQLSEVFFRFGVVQTLGMDTSGVFTVVGAGVWFGATIGVLLGMEALSAFLHSLRLHWVEFQTKFYQGDGVAFNPMDLVALHLQN